MCFSHDWSESEDCEVAIVRAAEDVACEECGRPIAAGAPHEYMTQLWAGEPDEGHVCLACVALRAAVEDHERAEGCVGAEAVPPRGELWECARELRLLSFACDGEQYDDDELEALRREDPFAAFGHADATATRAGGG